MHLRKVGTNWVSIKVLSFLFNNRAGEGEWADKMPRVLEFLLKELPSKGDHPDVSQGCLCILDRKEYFFIRCHLLSFTPFPFIFVKVS